MKKKKNEISDHHFLVEFYWMTKLGLKGNELRMYALIYSYSQDNQGTLFASIDYIKRRLSLKSRTSVFDIINKLISMNLIRKIERYEGNVRLVEYEIIPNIYTRTENVPPVQKMDGYGTENVLGGGTESVPNNKEEVDNKEIVKDILDKIDLLDKLDRVSELEDKITFEKHHVLTRYLINSGFLTQRDKKQFFRYDRFFEKFIGENGYEFEDYKLYVQYFIFKYKERLLSEYVEEKTIKNKYGYFITAMEKARWEFSQEKSEKHKLFF